MSDCATMRPARTYTFKRVRVYVTSNDTKVIEWRLDPCFPVAGTNLLFFVEIARSGGEWTRLNPNDPVRDSCVYVDDSWGRCNYDNDIYYRVILSDGVQEYASAPEPIMGVWNRHDWLIARDIVRREYLRLRKFVGVAGWLLKRRNYGVKCPRCLDYDTQQPSATNCALCFGTGFERGYFNGIPLWVDFSVVEKAKDVAMPLGTVDNVIRPGRCVAYPMVDEYDLWVDGDKNKRYLVRKLKTVAEVRAQPLVYVGEWHEIPGGRVEYDVPIDQPPPVPPGSSETPPTQGGWTEGISYIKW